MRRFIIDFHDNMTHIAEQGFTGIKDKLIRALPLIVLFLFVFVMNTMMTNGRMYHQRVRKMDNTITATLHSLSDTPVSVFPGASYETPGGIIESHRVYGESSAYRFYFDRQQVEEFYVFDEKALDWLGDAPDVPPAVAQAFIHHGIGIVDRYDMNGTAFIGDESYVVDYTPSLRVTIDDRLDYRPLPPLPTRVESFVRNHLEVSLDELEFLGGQKADGTETIYFSIGDELMQLIVNTDESATIATVIGHK